MRAVVEGVRVSLAAEEDAFLLAIFIIDLSCAFESLYPEAFVYYFWMSVKYFLSRDAFLHDVGWRLRPWILSHATPKQ